MRLEIKNLVSTVHSASTRETKDGLHAAMADKSFMLRLKIHNALDTQLYAMAQRKFARDLVTHKDACYKGSH